MTVTAAAAAITGMIIEMPPPRRREAADAASVPAQAAQCRARASESRDGRANEHQARRPGNNHDSGSELIR